MTTMADAGRPSWRVVLIVGGALLAIGAFLVVQRDPGPSYDRAWLEASERRLRDLVFAALPAENAAPASPPGRMARPNGYVYAVDVGQLLTYATMANDRPLYDRLRAFAVARLILPAEAGAMGHGMVRWRYRPEEAPDASGTTECLRVAEGLWRGAARFDRPDDRALAVTVLRAYCRHQGRDQDTWLIRNYYNIGSRSFATNSFLVDYDPDFVAEAARALNDQAFTTVAAESTEAVRRAASPCGLCYDLIQPEVKTLVPGLTLHAFSPNDIIQLSNALTVAERAVGEAPAFARRSLDFLLARLPRPNAYFLGRTGRAFRDSPAGVEVFAAGIRLAARAGDLDAVRTLGPGLRREAKPHLEKLGAPRLYVASEILLALAWVARVEGWRD